VHANTVTQEHDPATRAALRELVRRLNLSPQSRVLHVGRDARWADEFAAAGHLVETEEPVVGGGFDVIMISSYADLRVPPELLASSRRRLNTQGLLIFAGSDLKTTDPTAVPANESVLCYLATSLNQANLEFYQFFRPMSAIVALESDEIRELIENLLGGGTGPTWVIASPTEQGIRRVCRPVVAPVTFLEGAYSEEKYPDNQAFRWCQTRCHIRLGCQSSAALTVSNWLLPKGSRQHIYLQLAGELIAMAELSSSTQRRVLRVRPQYAGKILRLSSDVVFSESWTGGADRRLLSFVIEGFDTCLEP
jgi:hypothetical protein